MFGLSFWEIGLILLVALLVLGPQKLPTFLKTVGKGLRELRRASSDLRSAIEEPLDEVRKPLQEMKDDLVDAVYSMENELESEADDDEAPRALGEGDARASTEHDEDSLDGEHGLDGEDSFDDSDIDEERVKEVEAMYAAARGDPRPADAGESAKDHGEVQVVSADEETEVEISGKGRREVVASSVEAEASTDSDEVSGSNNKPGKGNG